MTGVKGAASGDEVVIAAGEYGSPVNPIRSDLQASAGQRAVQRDVRQACELVVGQAGRLSEVEPLPRYALADVRQAFIERDQRRDRQRAEVTNAKAAAENFKSKCKSWNYEVYADSGGNYRWRAKSSNGQTVGSSGESFSSQSNAQRAADNVRDSGGSATGP